MNAPKAKRGRPRKKPLKPPVGSMTSSHPFSALDDGKLSKENIASIVAMIRKRADKPPTFLIPATHVPPNVDPLPSAPQDANVAKWLSAAADALESGDGARAAYYLLHGLRSREEDLVSKLGELAQIGVHKLATDKRKGRRVQW